MMDGIRLTQLTKNIRNILLDVNEVTQICDIWAVNLEGKNEELLHECVHMELAYKISAEYTSRLYNIITDNHFDR